MQFPVSKHCDCFQHGVRVMDCSWNGGLLRLQLYRRQLSELAVSHHSHKIVVLSGLGRLVSERNNNSFPSVNLSLWGLYCIQLRLCQICSECEAFDCCKLVCYRCLDNFLLVFRLIWRPTTSRPFYFNINWPISDLIFLRRCIKFNPPIRVRLVLIGLWATQTNRRLNVNRGLAYLIGD